MNIYFSSATVQSYENHTQSMDLFYSPILIFDGIDFASIESMDNIVFTIESMDNIVFTIESQTIGNHQFDIQQISKATIQDSDTRCYLEFKLSKKEVKFSHDNYDCILRFRAILQGQSIEHSTLGIVKTKWKKGLL